MSEKPPPLFHDCTVAFVPSTHLPPSFISEMSAILESNGATICEPRRDGSLPIEKLSHIISNTIDFSQYTETQAHMIPVVTSKWINSSVARKRQAPVRPYSPDPRMIFANVVVTCADIPVTDKESILGAVMALGGQESKDVGKMTSHICALSMDHPKIEAAQAKKWKGKIVLPHWFDDCFKLGKRIDEGPYLLPDPEILRKSPHDALDIPQNSSLEGAVSANPEGPLPLPPSEDAAWPPATVFADKKIMLSNELNTSSRSRLLKAVQEIIVNGGGKLVEDVDECDMFICHYRQGDDYVKAARNCKEVGNLSWLYLLIIHNEWTSPLRRLLHYPLPPDGIEGLKGLRITVSNYGGEARVYLENLIKACGATFTKTMTAENTHLITARNTSDKCKAAPEWGITVVNHLWIEECYAKCEAIPCNIKKFNHFPPRTNLGEIIGRTFFDESRLRELYYPGGEEKLSPGAKRKRMILEAAEDNAYQHGPAEGVVIGRVSGRKKASGASADGEVKAVATPVRTRKVSGKENDTPTVVSTGGRSAKAKAKDMLHNIAPDIALYEKEKKRGSKPGTPFGGKRATDALEKKRQGDAISPEADDEDTHKRSAKKARTSLPGVDIRVIVTSFPRWVEDQAQEDKDRRKLRDLGIQVVHDGAPCDYLIAPRIVRTVKFLRALARGTVIITSDFLEEALQSGQVPDPDDYHLKDKENEDRWDFNLEKSMSRAKSHRSKLLWGMPIYCTDKIRNGYESYKQIAEANGAIFKVYRARSGTTIKPTTAEEDGNAPPEPVYLLTGTTAEEKQMWPRFRQMAEEGHMEPRIVSADWLLDVAMAQQVRFDKKFLIEEYMR